MSIISMFSCPQKFMYICTIQKLSKIFISNSNYKHQKIHISIFSKEIMSYFRYKQKNDSVQLGQAAAYTETSLAFQRFADSVVFQSSSYQMFSSRRDNQNARFVKLVARQSQKMGVKIIRPLKKICTKYLQAGKGLCLIHCEFLRLVIRFKVYKEALPILDLKEVPKKMEDELQNYYYYSFLINFYLKRYGQAKQLMDFAESNLVFNSEQRNVFDKLQSLVYMNFALNPTNIANNIYINDALKSSKKSQFSHRLDLQDQNSMKINLLEQMVRSGSLPKGQKQIYLFQNSSDINKKLYSLIDRQAFQLQQKIKDEINQNYQRIKTEQIGSFKLENLTTMQKINKWQYLGRYSNKQKILNLNHNKYTEQDIDKMVSKCFKIYQFLKKQQLSDMQSTRGQSRGLGVLGMRMM